MKQYWSKKQVLVIDWLSLPRHLKDSIADNQNFGNDRYLKYWSELETEWSINEIDRYMQDQKRCGNVEPETTVEEFAKDYGLELELFLIQQGNVPDFAGEEILIYISW